MGAGISTWRNSPDEWGGQWEEFGKRAASNFGKNLIKQTTTYGLDEALKLDSHYYLSKKKNAGSKIRNALLSPVTARNRRGNRVIGVPRIVGTYASSIVAAEAWYPERYGWEEGVRSGTVSFGISAAYNLFKEFVWKKYRGRTDRTLQSRRAHTESLEFRYRIIEIVYQGRAFIVGGIKRVNQTGAQEV
ncbi:MAG: hypothetical protein PSX80_02345 [bacterium]|nr:hypothetical protein [bacterium]